MRLTVIGRHLDRRLFALPKKENLILIASASGQTDGQEDARSLPRFSLEVWQHEEISDYRRGMGSCRTLGSDAFISERDTGRGPELADSKLA